jgi:hypothetical protein
MARGGGGPEEERVMSRGRYFYVIGFTFQVHVSPESRLVYPFLDIGSLPPPPWHYAPPPLPPRAMPPPSAISPLPSPLFFWPVAAATRHVPRFPRSPPSSLCCGSQGRRDEEGGVKHHLMASSTSTTSLCFPSSSVISTRPVHARFPRFEVHVAFQVVSPFIVSVAFHLV